MQLGPLLRPRAQPNDDGAPKPAEHSKETALGHFLSNTLNNVLLPLEVATLKGFERGYEALTGHVLFHALAPAPQPVALKRPLLMIPGLFMQPQSFDAVANHFASAPGARKTTAVYSTKDDEFHLKDVRAPA